jgi:hypothetical protein
MMSRAAGRQFRASTAVKSEQETREGVKQLEIQVKKKVNERIWEWKWRTRVHKRTRLMRVA